MSKFPQGFMVGASTAAHQVEGNNIHSDYWVQENVEHSQFVEPSAMQSIITTAMKKTSG